MSQIATNFFYTIQSREKISPNSFIETEMPQTGKCKFLGRLKVPKYARPHSLPPISSSHKNVAPFLPGLFPSKAYLNRIDINVLS